MGDSIDNVKGVPGIGEKGARDLIATYGTLDALLAHAAEMPQKRYREALLAHADEARQSRELLRIRTDVTCRSRSSAFRYRGRRPRALLRAVLAARLPHRCVMEYAPTAATVDKHYARRQRRRGTEPRWSRDARGGRPSSACTC